MEAIVKFTEKFQDNKAKRKKKKRLKKYVSLSDLVTYDGA